MVAPQPERMRIRMYQVGFGDCFLASWFYAKPLADQRRERHVLIDLGSTRRPVTSKLKLGDVAASIAASTDGQLDAIVVSHRHKDHLSGFGTAAIASIISSLKPKLVVRSWTENPRAKASAGKVRARSDAALLGLIERGQREAEFLVAQAARAKRGRQSNLVTMATAELANADAVKALAGWARKGSMKAEYLSAGNATALEDLLPGVQVGVIGPPRPKQWPAVSKQAADSEEYWLAAHRQAERRFTEPAEVSIAPPGPMRWITDRLRDDEQRMLLSLVRWLDDAMNNTSLILLIRTGGHTMLFGGDAQIENWGWALARIHDDDRAFRTKLEAVDLYKVGHHGSRNGTPKSLVAHWMTKDHPFISLMSTRPGVHGHDDRAVPREPLVEALSRRGRMLRTDEMAEDYVDVESDLPNGDYRVSFGNI